MISKKQKFLSLMAASALAGFTVSAVMACAPFQDSVFSTQLLSKETGLNLLAINKIKNVEADGVIRIAVLADAHQNYAALDQVIYSINQMNGIDFVVNLGDFTNSGYNLEYNQFIDSHTALRHPAIAVIGNHDSIGSGPSLYRRAFSEVNFWFESNTKRFIFFNSANLENPEEFNPQWLKDTIASSTKPVIIFTHVSLQDKDRYFGATAQAFSDVIADPKVLLILNGHNHVYNLDTSNSTVLLQSARVEGNNWLLLEIQGQQLTINNKNDGSSTVVTLKN